MAVRGPARTDKDEAQADADELERASKEGVAAVRSLAANMKRSRITAVGAD